MQELPGAGDRVGNYRLEREVGRGAFGVVFRAHHMVFTDRRVAIKLPAEPGHAAELLRAARIQHGIDHPGIQRVLDVDPDGRPPYLVLEWVAGETLRCRMVREGRIPPSGAVPILLAVLDALAAAHQAGVVHRDLKPDNVLLGRDGAVKVGDFGLALDTRRRRLVHSISDAGLAAALAGTLAYMAPEQRRPGPVDGRADLYALGVMLFEMVQGDLPALNDWMDHGPLDRVYHRLCAPLSRRVTSAARARRMLAGAHDSRWARPTMLRFQINNRPGAETVLVTRALRGYRAACTVLGRPFEAERRLPREALSAVRRQMERIGWFVSRDFEDLL